MIKHHLKFDLCDNYLNWYVTIQNEILEQKVLPYTDMVSFSMLVGRESTISFGFKYIEANYLLLLVTNSGKYGNSNNVYQLTKLSTAGYLHITI